MSSYKKDKPKKEFEELLLEVRRVTRVTTGGRRMSFRATVLVGNKKWKIGIGLSKGPDVSTAVKKASREAYKTIVEVPITKADTVPYGVSMKYKSCIVRLIPASAGTGLKAGSSVRSVLELAGYENILSKIIGSNNKLNNALTTVRALASYKHHEHFKSLRNKKGAAAETAEVVEEVKEAKKAPAKKTAAKKTIEEKKVAKKPAAKKTAKKEEKTE